MAGSERKGSQVTWEERCKRSTREEREGKNGPEPRMR